MNSSKQDKQPTTSRLHGGSTLTPGLSALISSCQREEKKSSFWFVRRVTAYTCHRGTCSVCWSVTKKMSKHVVQKVKRLVPVPYFQILRRKKVWRRRKKKISPRNLEHVSWIHQCVVWQGRLLGQRCNVAGLKLPRLPSEVWATFTCAVTCNREGEELTCQGPGFLNATVSISGSIAGVHIERRCLTATSLSAQVPPATNWTLCYYTQLSVIVEGDWCNSTTDQFPKL